MTNKRPITGKQSCVSRLNPTEVAASQEGRLLLVGYFTHHVPTRPLGYNEPLEGATPPTQVFQNSADNRLVPESATSSCQRGSGPQKLLTSSITSM